MIWSTIEARKASMMAKIGVCMCNVESITYTYDSWLAAGGNHEQIKTKVWLLRTDTGNVDQYGSIACYCWPLRQHV